MKSLLPIAILVLTAHARAQSFDAASIKPNRSLGGMSSIRLSKGRITMENASLKKIVLNAYAIPDDRDYMLVAPDWLSTETFDMEATFPGDAPASQVRQMLQTLLAERFKLALHKETRQLPVYSLEVSKNGPKIQAVEDGQGKTSSGPGQLTAAKITMQKLADLLARPARAPVVDATGLKGVFDFKLEWEPDETPATGPSLFTALEEQLGLRLVSRRGPFEVLIVDHMEKSPTGN